MHILLSALSVLIGSALIVDLGNSKSAAQHISAIILCINYLGD